MKKLAILRNDRGFTLVQALFILIVLALLGGAMLRLSGVQSSTSLFALQGARAYQAARSGLEWAAARARGGGSCTGSMVVEDFTVATTCSSAPFTEAATITTVYRISATAEFGSYGNPDYVLRRVEMKVGM